MLLDPAACRSDRDCRAGAFCDKSNDGDDIAPADDEVGVCVDFNGCLSDSDCPEDHVCFARRGTCEFFVEFCDPFDDQACAQEGEVCLSSDGRMSCRPPKIPTRCEVVLSRTVAVDGDDVDVGVHAFDEAGLVAGPAPPPVRASCGAGRCEQQVDVVVEGVGCLPATLTVHAALRTGSRIIVVDAGGAALADVPVRVIDAAGAVIEILTDVDGVALFAVSGSRALSILPATHEAHTVLDPPDDLLIVTRSERAERTGVVVTPDFNRVHTNGDTRLSASHAPLSTDLGRFSFDALLGSSSDVLVTIEGLTAVGGDVVALPDGLTLGVGDTDFRGRAVVVTAPPSSSKLFVWSIAGQASLSQIGGLFSDGGVDRDLVIDVLSLFGGRFDHDFIVVDAPAPRLIVDAADLDGNGVPDGPPADLPPVTVLPRTSLALIAELEPAAARTELAIVVADVPGAGLLPLGLREIDVDASDDGYVDHAPLHDGLEGYEQRTLVMAYEQRPWSDVDAVAVRIGPDFAAAPTGTIDGSQVVVDDVAGVDVLHARLTTAGHTWNVWSLGDVDVDVAEVTGAALESVDSAVLETFVLQADRGFALTNAGGLAFVDALTRVSCAAGICGP